MAPDLNSVPPSPRSQDRTASPTTQALPPSSSRRTPALMAPPPAVPQTPGSPNASRTSNTLTDTSGVGAGPGRDLAASGAVFLSNNIAGPLRHPQPLTASEIYLECEKEQEGIVNRLTRELSLLRQQTASVASTTSSTTSDLVSDYSNIVPTSARRHRSSSNLSTRSTRSINAATANATSVSAVAPARETSVPSSSRPSMDNVRPDLNRQDSATGRRSVTASPSLSSSHVAYGAPFGQVQGHQTQSNRLSSASQAATQAPGADSFAGYHARSPSFSAAVAAARYEEAAFHRAELDSVKRENEILRQRIKDLERSLGSRSAGERATRSGTTSALDH